MISHPLEPLSSEELAQVITALRTARYVIGSTRVASVSLREPSKEFVFNWTPGTPFPREAIAVLFDNAQNVCSKAWVDVRNGCVTKFQKVPGSQPLLTADEMAECERVVVSSPEFAAKLTEHYGNHHAARHENLICDIWSAGYYGDESGSEIRLARPLCFFKDPVSQNPYAYPIEGLRPVVDLNTMKLVRVEDYGRWPLPPRHYASHRANGMKRELRRDVKPLEIVQHDGPSFKVSGKHVMWQKWSLVVGFSGREGLTLHDVRYDGRPILYRAAISDMVVPYGDPGLQQARKNAFDVSDYGIGHCTNSLKLGCDCLGDIKYFNGDMVTSRGEPWVLENAVCMHEEDYGILWKHSDRHSGSVETRRSRRLVISSFSTVENYDYGFYWYFYQDGAIELEVKLTGFLSVGSRRITDPVLPKHGNLVAPQLYAPNHQHFFNFRLDFAVDGVKNTVNQVDVVPSGGDGTKTNPFSNAFHAQTSPYTTEQTATANVSTEKSRTWLITNETKKNYVGMPVAYQLIPGTNAIPLASRNAFWRKRARFVDHHVWVTPFNESEYFCAGEFPNQARVDTGLPVWTAQNRCIANSDCVLWYTFGVTHVPRPEDYPVMPTVYAGFSLKPYGFFDRNPGFDVPPQCHINTTGQGVTRSAKL